jgi:MSHA biogenesis protein MshQ
MVRLQFNRTINGDVVSGSSNAFVTKPARFTVTNITNAASPFTANPNPPAATAAGDKFIAAGAPFSATVTAVTSTNVTTPNFGKESTPESVILTPVLVEPSSNGTPGSLGGTVNLAGTQFTNGVATVNNLTYSEVGIMQLQASTASPSGYLGAGSVSGVSPNIGRFIPAGFAFSGFTVGHRSDLSCNPVSTFTYLGETLRIGFTLTAQNKAGTATKNYVGDFAKLVASTPANLNFAGIAGATMFKGNGLTLSNGTGSWAAGSAEVAFNAVVSRGAAPVGPFDTATFGIAPVDSDGVGMMTLDLDTDAPANGVDRARLGLIPLRYGRLRLQNAIATTGRAIKLPLTAQYWDSSNATFRTNDLDYCTRITSANLSFGNLRKTLTAADLVMSPATVTVNPTSPQFITLAAPGGGRLGSVDVAIALGSGSIPGDASCLKSVSNWTPTVAAGSGANLAGLRGAWCGNTSTSDHSARATWGLYRGSDGVLYQRENF